MSDKWFVRVIRDIIEVNPKESLLKGKTAKKISMDILRPFCRDISKYELTEYSGGAKFRNGDTIMARITPCLENGKIAKVNILDDNEVGFGSTEYIVFRAKEGVTDENFVYYLVCSPLIRDPAIKSMVGSSGRQRVQTDVIKNLEVSVPDIVTQRRIGSLLKSIDDKIAINTKINENLEQQAVALYQNALEINSDSLVYTTIGEICDVKGGKRLPKGINLITKRNSHPYIRVRDLNNSTVLALNNDFEYVDSETQKSISRYIVSTSDVIISIVGTIGLSTIVHESLNNANLTENCVKITNSNLASPEFILLFLKSDIGQNEIIKGTVGAVQLKLPIKNIQAIRISLLPEEKMNKLDKLIKPIFRQISSKVEENQRLSDLRDALLPKLMSGEIDVSQVQI